MTDIRVHLYDTEIVETDDAIELPPSVVTYDDLPDIQEAWHFMVLLVLDEQGPAAALSIDDLFFLGLVLNRHGHLRVIHTPAADAFFDEFQPGWRHGTNLPLNLN